MKLKGMAGTLRTLKDMEAEIEERFERNDAALYEARQQERLEEKHQWIEDTLMQLQDAIELLEDVRDSKMED